MSTSRSLLRGRISGDATLRPAGELTYRLKKPSLAVGNANKRLKKPSPAVGNANKRLEKRLLAVGNANIEKAVTGSRKRPWRTKSTGHKTVGTPLVADRRGWVGTAPAHQPTHVPHAAAWAHPLCTQRSGEVPKRSLRIQRLPSPCLPFFPRFARSRGPQTRCTRGPPQGLSMRR